MHPTGLAGKWHGLDTASRQGGLPEGGDDNCAMTATLPVPPPLSGQVRLSDWGLIRAQGPDAASFLQGQLTQDVLQLPLSQARLAGFCSPKGRLQASFVVWRDAGLADTLYLACSADLLPPTLKRLTMFVLRAKCKLADVSNEWALWGLAGASAMAGLGDALAAADWAVAPSSNGHVIRLPAAADVPRALLVQPPDAALPELPALAMADWQWLEARSGIARIVAATADKFVPQMVNFELTGGVNFQKGCYPGQEIVARSQYRGTLKRRAMVFEADAELAPGQEVFHSADPAQPAGMVALAARRSGGAAAALVEVKLAALGHGSLHAGSADGPVLRLLPLPYLLPSDA